MARIFKECGATAVGNVLPIDEFKLFLDLKNPKMQDDRMAEIVEQAEEFLNEDIEMLTLSMYREYRINGNRMHFQLPFHKRRDMANCLALAEAYERKGRFTEKLCDVIWAIMEESTWIVPAHNPHAKECPGCGIPDVYSDRQLHGIDLFAAVASATLTGVYYLCKDEIDEVSPIICEKLKYMVLNRCVRPYLQTNFSWEGESGNRVNNWCPWILSNVLFATAVLEDDTYRRQRVVEKALTHLDNFTSFYRDDGGCDEGPFYWDHAGGSYFDCLELIYDMTGGKIDVFSHPLVRNIGEYIAKFNINKDRFICTADSHNRFYHDGCQIRRYGERCGSAMLESFGVTMDALAHVKMNRVFHIYRLIKTMMSEKLPYKATRGATETYFDGIKVAIFRENEDTSRGMFLTMKGGNNDESHNHNDVGSFIVYYDGEPVLIDCGVGEYTKQTFSSDRYKLWFMQSGYHNLPSFGGVDQMNGAQFASHSEIYDGENKTFRISAERAYPEEAGLISYVRESQLDGGTVKICDDISLNEEKEIDFHFMCCTAPVLKNQGVISLPQGRELIYDSKLSCEIEAFKTVGMAEEEWGTDTMYRIHLRVTAKDIKTEFIVK